MPSLANPTRFLSLAGRVIPWLTALTADPFRRRALSLLLRGAARLPAGRDRPDHVRPCSRRLARHVRLYADRGRGLGTLIWRHPLADVAAKAAAPIGATFTFIALVTGSLWGKPMWGTYWVWDARLTSMLVLFLLYLGLIALWQAIEEPGRAGRAAAILALVGAINIPIIKFSVDWWNTLHQPASIVRLGGPTIDPSMLGRCSPSWRSPSPCCSCCLHLIAMRAEILRRRVRAMQQTQVEHAALVEA